MVRTARPPAGKPLVVRGDSAMATKGFLTYARATGVKVSLPVGTQPKVQAAIRALHADADVWAPAVRQDGSVRDGAHVAELTDMPLDEEWPEGLRTDRPRTDTVTLEAGPPRPGVHRRPQQSCVSSRLVTAGAHGGGHATIDVRRLYLRRNQVIGAVGGSRRDIGRTLGAAARKHAIRAHIGRVLPLDRACEAHELVAPRAVLGKVVLEPP